MKVSILLVIVISVLFLEGCATASGPKFTPLSKLPEDKATVYIYRPYVFFNSGGYPNIFVNGEKMFSLPISGFGVLTLLPGNYEIMAKGSTWGTNWYPGPVSEAFSFKAGLDYYLRVIPWVPANTPSLLFFSRARTQLKIIPKKEALQEIYETKSVP